MTTTNYLLQIKTPRHTISMLLKYSDQDELVHVELRDFNLKMTDEQRNWLWAFLPKTSIDLKAIKSQTVKVTELETDLSFEAFWDLYDYKVGNKIRARKHWEQLDDATRAMAIQKVKEYNFYMAHKTHDKVFPERWLSQKRYENEFKLPR